MDIQPGIYRQYNGTIVETHGMATNAQTQEKQVVYASLYDGSLWTYPLNAWQGDVEIQGVRQPSFEYLAKDLDDLDSMACFPCIEDLVVSIRSSPDELASYYCAATGEIYYPQLQELYDAESIINSEYNTETGEVSSEETLFHKADQQYMCLGPEKQVALHHAIDLLLHEDQYESIVGMDSQAKYKIMQDYVNTCQVPTKVRDSLLESINGKGAFRRFRDCINRMGMRASYIKFREKCFRTKAREWCTAHNIRWGDIYTPNYVNYYEIDDQSL